MKSFKDENFKMKVAKSQWIKQMRFANLNFDH